MMSSLPSEPSTAEAASKAQKVNQELLQLLIAGLMKDPEVNLMSLVPSAYESQVTETRKEQLEDACTRSKAALLNRKTISALLSQIETHPTHNLLAAFPESYAFKRDRHLRNSEDAKKEDSEPKNGSTEDTNPAKGSNSRPFFAPLERIKATSLEIMSPLSPAVAGLLKHAQTQTGNPVEALKHIIRSSECLWVGPAGARFVAKLDGEIAVKVAGVDQSNHYATLEYLAKQTPDLPIPRPHGLIRLGGKTLLFTSYIPKLTLAMAWPNLTYQQKLSIKSQLDNIFTRIRQIDRDGRPLGLVNGQGVVDERGRHDEFRPDKNISTAAEFEDFLFSYKPWITDTYIDFLKMLLPMPRFDEECVLTHTDVRPANIMVDKTDQGDWVVTGIIDWEDAGFYPAYWEAVKSTRTFLANTDNDWYLMQPQCIAPSTFPKNWLVDRLWESMIEEFRKVDRDPRVRRVEAERRKKKEEIWEENGRKSLLA